jgi:hypothetical protein
MILRGGSRDSVDGGLSYGAIFSIIDGTNCSPKAVLKVLYKITTREIT